MPVPLRNALFLALAGGCLLLGCARDPVQEAVRLRYAVRAVPDHGFEVELRAGGFPRGVPGLRILNGWGMIQNQPGRVGEVLAWDLEGREVPVAFEAGEEAATWTLTRDPRGAFRLRYRVRPHDPHAAPHASFVSRERMLCLGYSLFLAPRNLDYAAPLNVIVSVETPEGWERWSSWPGAGPYRPGSIRELWGGVVAAGDFLASGLAGDGLEVTVLTEGTGNRTLGLNITNRLFPVLREMIGVFGAPPRGPSLDVLAVYRTMPRRGNKSVMIGTSEERAFLCVATPDRYRDPDDLTALAAHECLHFYLGGAVTASPEPPFRNSPDLVWLMEGLTEYLSFRLMERAGVLTSEGRAEVERAKEEKYRENPFQAGTSLADAARMMSNIEAYALVYTRGYLVGRLLDREMTRRCGAGALDGFLRRLFEEHAFAVTGRSVTPEAVGGLLESECPGSFEAIRAYAEGSRVLPRLPAGGSGAGVLGRE